MISTELWSDALDAKVDSYDAASWSSRDISLEERARNHGRYESWILGEVLPWICQDCGGALEVATPGCVDWLRCHLPRFC